ncbi:hypothetical protein [Agilicoccus flavus]|uniref:hypothetical protein n=1 Tax=Agilicoccus flavus TaxID=2775968 RepID=UPI001CF64AA1|nr:hypothetical protein [Agilicoccus flavus]
MTSTSAPAASTIPGITAIATDALETAASVDTGRSSHHIDRAPAPLPASLRGGLLLMGIFTLGWMMNAAAAPHALLSAFGGLGLLAGAALLLGAAFVAVRERRIASALATSPPAAPTPGPAGGPTTTDRRPSIGRTFALAGALEVAGIVAVVVAFGRTRPEFVMPAVALVVALHFFVFYRADGARLHLVMTAIGVVVALAGLALAAAGTDPALVRGIVGLGMGGVTLGYGAVFALALARLARR